MKRIIAWFGLFALAATAAAQDLIPVTVDNFVRAESDMYIAGLVKDSGGQLAKFNHRREVADIDHQTVIGLNRDTLYSSAVFDLDAGPVTVTLPDAGDRFRSMQVISEDHYVPAVSYDSGPHTLTREMVGTRYVVVAIRALVDPNDPADVAKVHALQDGITVQQANHGSLEIPRWDPLSHKKVRDALLVLSSTSAGFGGAFVSLGGIALLIGNVTRDRWIEILVGSIVIGLADGVLGLGVLKPIYSSNFFWICVVWIVGYGVLLTRLALNRSASTM